MKRFLSAETIKASVQRLVDSRARDGLVHFLLLKRALARAQTVDVPFSSNDVNFTGAMRDLAATYPPNSGLEVPPNIKPFVKVFGTAGAAKYVSGRWTTNGPADTLSGPKWNSVVHLVKTRPRRGSFAEGYVQHLDSLLLKSGHELPTLADTAIWYHRATDLQARFGDVTDSKELEEQLRTSFIQDLDLTDEEIALLFDAETKPLAGQPLADVLRDEVANPLAYLPDLGPGSGNLPEMIAAFETLANGTTVGLRVSRPLLLRFVAALGAKRFLILTGLAGSGKTKLAQAFARWLPPAALEGQLPPYAVIPVGADWTGNDNILGYPDGLDSTRYVTRPALDLIQRAAQRENATVPHFLILDEMNLSHVERYFADLLSLIESGETTELYRPAVGDNGQPQLRTGAEPTLRLSPNLFIIGTVNVDETTYMFSPKVLDRANVVEFRMVRDDLTAFLAAPRTPALDQLNGRGSSFGAAFVAEAGKEVSAPEAVHARFEAELTLFFDLLRDHGAEFGFRVVNEAARFLHFYRLLGGFADDSVDWFEPAMDAVIVQKLLPKLHGSRPKLEGLLWALAFACGADRTGLEAQAFLARCREAGTAQEETKYSPEAVEKALAGKSARYPLSFDKIMRMYRKLLRDQFVTFSEA
jgi:MoxR-like ATPase